MDHGFIIRILWRLVYMVGKLKLGVREECVNMA